MRKKVSRLTLAACLLCSSPVNTYAFAENNQLNNFQKSHPFINDKTMNLLQNSSEFIGGGYMNKYRSIRWPVQFTNNSLANQMIQSETVWIESLQRDDGAILDTPNLESNNMFKSTPYFSNLAAIALTMDPDKKESVEKYIDWYLSHINKSDQSGLQGTIVDFYIDQNGNEISSGSYDSADSYAATFIMLLHSYISNGGNKDFLKKRQPEISMVGDVMIKMMDSDGLTFAKSNYKVKYLMDNCEVFKGLTDMADLYETVFHDSKSARTFYFYAQQNKNAILKDLSNNQEFYVYIDGDYKKTVNWRSWYPDCTSQMFPVLYGIIDPKVDRAHYLYQKLNDYFPNWSELNTGDAFPWTIVGYTSAIMGDWNRVWSFNLNIKSKYIDYNHPWTWYSAESAWYLQMNRLIMTHNWF